MANGWTLERRTRAAEQIQRRKPRELSTGSKTEAGKAAAARNAYQGGSRPQFRALTRALKEQRNQLASFLD